MNQIRPSEIDELFRRVRQRAYPDYLFSMELKRLRGFVDASVRFDFPVTALVGPNGAGKTTVLGAAGLIYSEVPPRRFFARSGVYDRSMAGWKVEYDVRAAGSQIPRTASYTEETEDARRSKWNRKAVARPVEVIGVNRTLPLSERSEGYRFGKGDFIGINETAFQENVTRAIERILGKTAADYLQVDADAEGKYSILARRPADESLPGYSEFHFGAGEASIIRIVSAIEAVQNGALILIEEVENGLHPLATQRLVEYLMDVCRRKGTQVIFTTHSNAALKPLPGDAVWSAHRGRLAQGKLDVESLRALTGEIEARLALFAEDKFGSLVAEVTLRRFSDLSDADVDLSGIEIHALGGASQARDQARYNNNNPSRTYPAVALLDGDKRTEDGYDPYTRSELLLEGTPFVTFIPGAAAPEATIFDGLIDLMEEDGRVLPRLTMALQLDLAHQGEVQDVVKEVAHLNRDRHTVFQEVGERLSYLSADVTARAFVSTWTNFSDEGVRSIWSPISALIPRTSDRPA